MMKLQLAFLISGTFDSAERSSSLLQTEVLYDTRSSPKDRIRRTQYSAANLDLDDIIVTASDVDDIIVDANGSEQRFYKNISDRQKQQGRDQFSSRSTFQERRR